MRNGDYSVTASAIELCVYMQASVFLWVLNARYGRSEVRLDQLKVETTLLLVFGSINTKLDDANAFLCSSYDILTCHLRVI